MADELKKHAQLAYRWFALPEDLRQSQYKEFAMLCDQHRWHEAEIMLGKLEKAAQR